MGIAGNKEQSMQVVVLGSGELLGRSTGLEKADHDVLGVDEPGETRCMG